MNGYIFDSFYKIINSVDMDMIEDLNDEEREMIEEIEIEIDSWIMRE